MPANLVNLWVRTPPGNKGLTILEKSPANNLFAANANLQDFFENLQIFATLITCGLCKNQARTHSHQSLSLLSLVTRSVQLSSRGCCLSFSLVLTAIYTFTWSKYEWLCTCCDATKDISGEATLHGSVLRCHFDSIASDNHLPIRKTESSLLTPIDYV